MLATQRKEPEENGQLNKLQTQSEAKSVGIQSKPQIDFERSLFLKPLALPGRQPKVYQSKPWPEYKKDFKRLLRSGFGLLFLVKTSQQIAKRAGLYAVPTYAEKLLVLGASLLEFGWHLSHPAKVGGRIQILVKGFTESRELSEKIEKNQGVKRLDAELYLQRTMGKSYFLGILTAVGLAAPLGKLVQHSLQSPALGMLSVAFVDYAVQVAAFSGLFFYRHKDYFFDKFAKEEATKRRAQFLGILKTDVVVSAVVYSSTFAATKGLVAILPSIRDFASPTMAVLNFVTFATVALGNVMTLAKFMTPSYQAHLEARKAREK